jgi:hypothetical protein
MPKLGLASILTLFLTAPIQAIANSQIQVFPPIERANPKQYPGCPGGPSPEEFVKAIDFSQPADDGLLNAAWDQGVRVIFRYYDWEEIPDQPSRQCDFTDPTPFNRQFEFPWKQGSTLRRKTLTEDERDRIHAKGFSIGIVFQHCNDGQQTFTDQARAAFDANRALELADRLSQPRGTTIFFGADFNALANDIADIKRYFKVVGRAIKSHGYKLGVYGNGYVCKEIKHDGLASYCWLSQSTGFQDSQAYARSGEWDVKQCATRQPFGQSKVNFDTDILVNAKAGIGLWRPTR